MPTHTHLPAQGTEQDFDRIVASIPNVAQTFIQFDVEGYLDGLGIEPTSNPITVIHPNEELESPIAIYAHPGASRVGHLIYPE